MTDPNRQQTREESLALLVTAWMSASQDRRTRALTNAGPITLAKLDATATRVAAGLPAKGMPQPDHTIRDRQDPRIPGQAADVAARMAAFNAVQLAETFTWTSVDLIRHVTVDLSSDDLTIQLVARITDAHRMVRLADSSLVGRVLYAHLSWQPQPILIATIALPRLSRD